MNAHRICAIAALGLVHATLGGTTVFEDNFDTQNGGLVAQNFNGFSQWSVFNGTVDLIGSATPGNALADVYPGNGLYVDLDGTASNAGDLRSVDVALSAGTYVFAFDLGDTNFAFSQTDPNSMIASVSGVFAETFTSDDTNASAFVSISRQFEVTTDTVVSIGFSGSGGDNHGLVIDNVSLTLVPAPGTLGAMSGVFAPILLRFRSRRS